MLITNYDLKKKLAEVQQQTKIINNATNNTKALLEEPGTVVLNVENIIKVNNTILITDQGTRAEMFNPAPCFYWKCTGRPDSNGDIILRNPLKGLFIHDGGNSYCLGVAGGSDEFEPRLQVGDNEIRLNNLFLNISAAHIIKNGLEIPEE